MKRNCQFGFEFQCSRVIERQSKVYRKSFHHQGPSCPLAHSSEPRSLHFSRDFASFVACLWLEFRSSVRSRRLSNIGRAVLGNAGGARSSREGKGR